MELEMLRKIASAMILDARAEALLGTKDERDDLRRWMHGEKAPWTFDDTCSVAGVDPIKLRNDLTTRLIARERAERRGH